MLLAVTISVTIMVRVSIFAIVPLKFMELLIKWASIELQCYIAD